MIPLPAILTLARWLLPALAGFAAAWTIQGWRLDAERNGHAAKLAAIALERETERRQVAEETARRLQAAQEAEREALAKLATTKADLVAIRNRLKEAINGLPTASNCGLSDPARRLLNDAIAGDAMSSHPAEPARTDAAAAADPGVTEGDLGAWIADAIVLYGECRARIEAIREWDAAQAR